MTEIIIAAPVEVLALMRAIVLVQEEMKKRQKKEDMKKWKKRNIRIK